jgi:hypothetical protein
MRRRSKIDSDRQAQGNTKVENYRPNIRPHLEWFNRSYDELYDRMGDSQYPQVARRFWMELIELMEEFRQRVFVSATRLEGR